MQRKILLSCVCLLILLGSSSITLPQVEEVKSHAPITSPHSTVSYGEANVELTWTANDSPIPSGFTTDVISGDHITISAVSSDFPVIGYAGLYLNPYIEHIETLHAIVDDGFDPFSDRIEFLDYHFFWIPWAADQGVRYPLVFDFTTSNCDVMAWSELSNQSEWYYSNNLLGSSMSTASNPEISNLVWPVDPSFTIWFAIYNHDTSAGSANFQFYYDIEATSEVDSNTVSYDTYNENVNFESPILYCSNIYSTVCSYVYIPLTFFENYFYPEVNILTPEIGANWTSGLHNITWTASDRNEGDELWFELSLPWGEPGHFIDLGLGKFDYDPHSDYFYHTINATGIQRRNYTVRIVGHDNDTTIPGTWPNLQVIKVLGPFIFGDVFEVPVVWPETNHPVDIQFTEGEIGHSIKWTIDSTFPIEYTVYLNSHIITEGTWREGEIEVSLDYLLAGTYTYMLYLDPGPSDTVVVTVHQNSTPTGSDDPLYPPNLPLLIFNIGTVAVIVVLIIRTAKHKDEIK